MEIVAERKKPDDEKLLRPLVSQKFPYVGGNSILEAIPQVAHFGGFKLNQPISQKIRILNKSNSSTRMHIVVPNESPFQVQYNRKGNVYPGASEELLVTFTGSVFKYYYDCIKIHSEAGNFIVPLHAYPVVNKVNFPLNIYFGTKPLGQLSKRTISIDCSVPIEFEYRITIMKEHSSIKIHPLEGTIPANGKAEIVIEFQPILMASVFSEIELSVSQFGFTPMTCTISGSSAPGIKDKEQEDISVDKKENSHVAPSNETPETSETTEPPPIALSKKKKRAKQPPEDEDIDIVEGIKIPKKMDGINATNFVLTQQPGKLKPKDLKRAIDENRALRKRQKAEQEALRHKVGSAENSRLSFEVILMDESVASKPTTRQLKELVFLQELQEIEKIEKELEFQSHREYLGEPLLNPGDIQFILDVRSFSQKERERDKRESLRNTFSNLGSSVQSTHPMRPALPAFHAPSHIPDFNPYKNDMWAKRKRILVRFVQVVSKCIIQLRAWRRLKLLKKWIGSATTRQEVRKMVERDWKFAQVSISDISFVSKSKDELQNTDGENESGLPSAVVLFHSFPLYLESESRNRFPVATSTETTFDDLDFFSLHLPLETDLMEYHPQSILPIPQYPPLESKRKYRSGALHESGKRPPRAIARTESSITEPTVVPLTELNWLVTIRNSMFIAPPATPRIYTPLVFPRETDPEYILQPQLRDLQLRETSLSQLMQKPGSISLGITTPYQLHTKWIVSTEREQNSNSNLWDLPPDSPALIDTKSDVDIPIDVLSDSESDNEDVKELKIPTHEDARKLFEDALDFDIKTLESFPRYTAWLQLDAEYTTYRYDLCMQLPKRMEELARHVQNPKTPFVLEGHGELLPQHSWKDNLLDLSNLANM